MKIYTFLWLMKSRPLAPIKIWVSYSCEVFYKRIVSEWTHFWPSCVKMLHNAIHLFIGTMMFLFYKIVTMIFQVAADKWRCFINTWVVCVLDLWKLLRYIIHDYVNAHNMLQFDRWLPYMPLCWTGKRCQQFWFMTANRCANFCSSMMIRPILFYCACHTLST